MSSVDVLREALKVVEDPEIGINVVDLGLVYDISLSDEGNAHIVFTLTSMGCPVGPMIEQELKDAASGVEGVREVTTELVMKPAWSPDRMSDFAKSALGFF
jgi:metal-sulfur cluster biosynthetic enzyme